LRAFCDRFRGKVSSNQLQKVGSFDDKTQSIQDLTPKGTH